MNRAEAAKILPQNEERRFLIQSEPLKMVIINHQVQTHPDHVEIAADLVQKGVFAAMMGISGGYCISMHENVRFWGTAVGPVLHATKEQFDQTINTVGADII